MSLDGTGAETCENVNSLYINYLHNQTLPLDNEFFKRRSYVCSHNICVN